MNAMSGGTLLEAPPASRPGENVPRQQDELFGSLVASNPSKFHRWFGFRESLIVHTVAIGGAVLIAFLWPSPPPETPDYIRALLYNPPPPPPPPLPRGTAMIEKSQPAKPVTPDPHPKIRDESFTPPIEVPKEAPIEPEKRPPETEQAGSPNGSDFGMAEGMEEGVEGGVVGGVPGGVLGGVIGGTGDGPVLDYDQPPKLIKQTRPRYPQEAFVKKIEGTVIIEGLINASGQVVPIRIVQSIPALNPAAVECVKEWVFTPAMKQGRPVTMSAQFPVKFRIF